MSKHYVILNFTDYRSGQQDASQRTTPISTLRGAIDRRTQRKGGTFTLLNMADIFGSLRLQAHRGFGTTPLLHHEMQGLFNLDVMSTLMVRLADTQPLALTRLIVECMQADKIIFAAHGLKDDTDHVYCDHTGHFIRLGSIRGVALFLITLLKTAKNTKTTVTLVVCYAARVASHGKHHLNDVLTASDLRSSLAFKLFQLLSASMPGIRLTARTGAMSGSDSTSSLLSETEEAIIAAEVMSAEFPEDKANQLVREANDAYTVFDRAIQHSHLTSDQKRRAQDAAYRWFTRGCDPNDLESLLHQVEVLDERGKSRFEKFVEYMGAFSAGAAMTLEVPDYSFSGQYSMKHLRKIAARRHRLYQLKTASQENLAKYGKFIYHRSSGQTVVSRWIPNHHGAFNLAEVARL